MSDRSSLYAAMYLDADTDDDALAVATAAPEVNYSVVTIPAGLRASRITVDDKVYSVPSMAYVAALERLIGEQAAMIAEMRTRIVAPAAVERTVADHARQLRQLHHQNSQFRHFLRKQTGRVGEMQVDLDNKIDRRDR